MSTKYITADGREIELTESQPRQGNDWEEIARRVYVVAEGLDGHEPHTLKQLARLLNVSDIRISKCYKRGQELWEKEHGTG